MSLCVLSIVSFVPFVFFVPPARILAAAGGTIRGRVELRRVAPPVERRPTVSELGAPAARDVSDRLRSVVYLESAPRGAFEQSRPGRAVLNQREERFDVLDRSMAERGIDRETRTC